MSRIPVTSPINDETAQIAVLIEINNSICELADILTLIVRQLSELNKE